MISLETVQATSRSIDPLSSPRVSFSSDSLDDEDFISINPNSLVEIEQENLKENTRNVEFEFLSSNNQTMLSADELFFDGKLLSFWQMQQSEKLKKISLGTVQQSEEAAKTKDVNKVESRVSWFLDDDPSPRPPKCNVLWKELLRLRKHRSSTLSPSSSLSSSSSSSFINALDFHTKEEATEGLRNTDKHVKRIKKSLERTRSVSIRIRPVVTVPICRREKSNTIPTLFSLIKGKQEK